MKRHPDRGQRAGCTLLMLLGVLLGSCEPGSTLADRHATELRADVGAAPDRGADAAAQRDGSTPSDSATSGADARGDATADARPFDSGQSDLAALPPVNDALADGQSVPATAVAGGTVDVAVTMRNTGTTTWSHASEYKLGSAGPRDNTTWGTTRIYMDQEAQAPPGATYTFRASLSVPGAAGTYTMQWQMVQEAVEWFGGTTAGVSVEVVAAPGGPRTPDPAPGEKLPLPDMYHVVQEVAAQHPEALANSCQDTGGTWEFMDRVVDRLREVDTRWGYNWKRGVVGDPSKDVVDYHWGPGPDEGSTDVYIIDIITGHCGDSPSAGWIDVTQATLDGGTIGRWTGRDRF